jgi:aminopeptidase N
MLLTNFFPISARRIFPCRDEPAVKSEIHFTMQTSLNFTTITANLPKNYIEYKEGQRWTHFHSIKNISTYQLNFAVLNNVKNITKIYSNKTFITYTTTSNLTSVDLAHEIYEKSMTILETYTQINYPLNTFINLILPEKIDAASSSSLGFIITKYF